MGFVSVVPQLTAEQNLQQIEELRQQLLGYAAIAGSLSFANIVQVPDRYLVHSRRQGLCQGAQQVRGLLHP